MRLCLDTGPLLDVVAAKFIDQSRGFHDAAAALAQLEQRISYVNSTIVVERFEQLLARAHVLTTHYVLAELDAHAEQCLRRRGSWLERFRMHYVEELVRLRVDDSPVRLALLRPDLIRRFGVVDASVIAAADQDHATLVTSDSPLLNACRGFGVDVIHTSAAPTLGA